MGYSENFYIGYSNVNKDLELSDSGILKIFEDIATMHSEAVGDGMRDTDSRWFLTSYKVKINKRPVLSEKVKCTTWSRDMKGFTASREFEIYNSLGEISICGLSNWARIDTKTGKLERLTHELGRRYGMGKDRANFESPWISKLKEPDEYQITKDYYIDRNFIDSNNHMNNVCYLDLAKCILPDSVYEKPAEGFEIIYRKAVMYGTTVKCCYGTDGKSHTVAIKCDNEVMAIVKFY